MRARMLPLLLALLLCLSPLSALAEELWSEEYYRAIDYTDQLTDLERESLDEDCLAFLRRAHADLALIAATGAQYDGATLASFAREVYGDCGFGYGAGHTGFVMAWDTQTDDVVLLPMGGAEGVVPQSYLDFVAGAVAKYRAEHGVFGPLYATVGFLNRYLDDYPPIEQTPTETPFWSADSVNPRMGTDGARPAWYPVSPDTFQKYHDQDAPRIVDNADLFDARREAALEQELARLREELGRDIVVFTDLSAYGLSHAVYAADFYDFNGYGVGENYEGVCLFVCMDPDDRGFYTCCTGPDTRGLFTESAANELDDILFPYMKSGAYAEGLTAWLDGFRRLCRAGSAYAPDWLVDDDPDAPRTQDPDAPRVVDDGDLLTEAEEAALRRQADSLRESCGVDVALCTASSSGYLTAQEYADRFYAAHGYGVGEQYDGILLTVLHAPGSERWETVVSCYGSVSERLSDTAQNRLRRRCHGLVCREAYAKALSGWLDQTGHALRTGRAPRSALSWLASAVGSMLVGALAGGISLSRAKRGMQSVSAQTRAGRYLDPSGIRIEKLRDTLRNTSTSRTYSPVRERSSDSGSSHSGRSTYHASYKGSSGTTHTGSGRRF